MMSEVGVICGIYKITSPSGRVYIGQAINISKRWRGYSKYRCSNQRKLYYSLKKYGVEKHTFEIVEECLEDDLNCVERYWQDFYDVLNGGLNLVLQECGAERRILSKETRDIMSEKMKGNKRGLGTRRSEEFKEEVSERMKGNNHGGRIFTF